MSRGFSLVELLVAIFLLALMSAFGYRALDGLYSARDRVEQEAERWKDRGQVFFFLELELDAALNRPGRDAAGNPVPAVAIGEEGSLLAYSHGAAAWPRRSAWRLRNGVLEYLRWEGVDRAAAAQPQVSTALTEVEDAAVRFLVGNAWQNQPPVEGLPAAVELALRPRGAGWLRRIVLVGGGG